MQGIYFIHTLCWISIKLAFKELLAKDFLITGGIHSNQWYKPGRLTVKNLPQQFQKEGIVVNCNVSIVDVIGTGEWDTYVEVNNCVKK